MDQIVSWLAGWIVEIISYGGYLGIVVLMALESACLPLPSEVVMPFAGYLASTGRFDLLLATTTGAIGCNIGSEIAYLVGAWGGRSFIDRWGRFVLLSPSHVAWAERFFARYGGIAVFITRLLPVVRSFIALPAGVARMPRLRFHLYTFLGSWPWCFMLTYAGYRLGEQWDRNPTLRTIMHRADIAILALVVLLVVWHVWRSWRRHDSSPTGRD